MHIEQFFLTLLDIFNFQFFTILQAYIDQILFIFTWNIKLSLFNNSSKQNSFLKSVIFSSLKMWTIFQNIQRISLL